MATLHADGSSVTSRRRCFTAPCSFSARLVLCAHAAWYFPGSGVLLWEIQVRAAVSCVCLLSQFETIR